jgi:predicted pyridoxine 5'-phosphate oxidase superfamily flavin-nucleotide-binding protein
MSKYRQQIINILRNRKFIYLATSDFSSRPNAAPKFLLFAEGDFIYAVDYVLGRTYRNLKINPQVSIPLINLDTLVGYQINATAEIIDKGRHFEQLLDKLQQKTIKFSAQRVIAGVQKQKQSKYFEVMLSEVVVIFKMRINEIVKIGPMGSLKKESY